MDILGIGWLELVFILIIAMIVVGPRDLGKVGKQIGHFLNRVYKSENWKMFNDASRTLRNLPNRLAREAALEDLDSIRDSLKDTGQKIKGKMDDFNSSLESWTPALVPPKNEPEQSADDKTETPAQPATEDKV
jgi:sec-independent protein translocase protein TatB